MQVVGISCMVRNLETLEEVPGYVAKAGLIVNTNDTKQKFVTLHGTNGRAHQHGSRYALCSATALHRFLYLHCPNRSMNVAQCRKCLSDLVITSIGMKRRTDEHSKTWFWFVNTQVYSLLHIFVVDEKRETMHELARPLMQDRRQLNIVRSERERKRETE